MGLLDASTSPPKERYAVSKDNIIKLIQPGTIDDQLTEILRNGARALLAQAVEAEVADPVVVQLVWGFSLGGVVDCAVAGPITNVPTRIVAAARSIVS